VHRPHGKQFDHNRCQNSFFGQSSAILRSNRGRRAGFGLLTARSWGILASCAIVSERPVGVTVFGGSGMMAHSRKPDFRQELVFAFVAAALTASSSAQAAGFFDNIKREAGSCLSGGCDVIYSANRRIDAGIASKMENAVGPAKAAVEEVLQTLFHDDIDPMLDKVNHIAADLLTQVDNIVQKTIVTVASAADVALDGVKNKIIDEGAAQIKDVAASIVKDVTCTELQTKEQVQSFVDDNFRIFGKLRDAAAGLLDRCQVGLDRDNYWTVYTALKCGYEEKIAHAVTVGESQGYYLAFLEETAKAECVLLADEGKEHARADHIAFSKRLGLWELALK
jgi:hypothetical protein